MTGIRQLALACALVVLRLQPAAALEQFNSPENELAITGTSDEAWIERRAGTWGKGSEPSRILHATRNASGAWSAPEAFEVVMAGGDAADPFYHAASQTLYFTSSRAHPALPDSQANIWRVRRTRGGWGQPEPLPEPVNGPGVAFSPVLAGGHLYFAAWNEGRGDLYRAPFADGAWTVERLGPAINSPTGEWNLWVSEDESLLVFEASERATNVSVSGDLYASIKDAAGNWLPALPLNAVNGRGSELNLRPWGEDLVYASTTSAGSHADLFSLPMASVVEAVKRAYDARLHVVSRSSHWVREIDLLSGETVEDAAIGPGPHLLSTGSGRLAVAAYGEYPRPHADPVEQMPGWVQDEGGELLIVGKQQRQARLPCRRPHGTAFDGRAERLWVTCEDRRAVVEVDLRQQPPAQRILPTDRAGAHVLAWDEAREQLLVAHTEAGGVAFMNPVSGEVSFLALAPGAEALHVDRERGELWVTLGPSSALAVIDLDSRKEVARLKPGCAFPIDFAVDGRGQLWVACFGSREVVALDRAARKVVDRLALPAGPLNIEAHRKLQVLYASLPRQNRVVEVSVTGRGVTRSFDSGIEPDGLGVVLRR